MNPPDKNEKLLYLVGLLTLVAILFLTASILYWGRFENGHTQTWLADNLQKTALSGEDVNITFYITNAKGLDTNYYYEIVLEKFEEGRDPKEVVVASSQRLANKEITILNGTTQEITENVVINSKGLQRITISVESENEDNYNTLFHWIQIN